MPSASVDGYFFGFSHLAKAVVVKDAMLVNMEISRLVVRNKSIVRQSELAPANLAVQKHVNASRQIGPTSVQHSVHFGI